MCHAGFGPGSHVSGEVERAFISASADTVRMAQQRTTINVGTMLSALLSLLPAGMTTAWSVLAESRLRRILVVAYAGDIPVTGKVVCRRNAQPTRHLTTSASAAQSFEGRLFLRREGFACAYSLRSGGRQIARSCKIGTTVILS